MIEATYTYEDDRGRPVIRKERSTTKKFTLKAARVLDGRMSWRSEPGAIKRWQPEWAEKAMFNLPVLLDALNSGAPTWFVEGERCANTLTTLKRLPTTTNWQGASAFTMGQAEWFVKRGKGRSVVNLIADNDPAGAWAVWLRYTRLLEVGADKRRIKIWRPSGGAKDITDVALGGFSGKFLAPMSPSAAEDAANAEGAKGAAQNYKVKGDDDGINHKTGFVYGMPEKERRGVRDWKPGHP